MDYINGLFLKIRNKISSETKWALICGMICMIITHIWYFTFCNWNNDDVQFRPIMRLGGVELGRWARCIPFTSEYLLPIPTFVFSILFISITCALLISILKLKDKLLIALVCGLIVTFPALSEMYGYSWLIEGYTLGIFFSVLSVWLVDHVKHGVIWGAVALAFSLGEYQSFLACTMCLLVMKSIQCLFENNYKQSTKIIVRYILMGILAGIIYFAITKISLVVSGTSLRDYKGLDSMGSIPLNEIPILLKKTFSSFFGYFFGTKFYGNNIFIRWVFIITMIFILIELIVGAIKLKLYRDVRLAFLFVMITVFPICANITDFVGVETSATCLNIYAFVFVFVAFIQLIPHVCSAMIKMSKNISTKITLGYLAIVVILMTSVIYNNFLITNIYYSRLNKYAEYTLNMSNRMLMRIETMQSDNSFREPEASKLAVISGCQAIYRLSDEPFSEVFLTEQGSKHKFNGWEGGVGGKRSVSVQAASNLTNGLGANFIAASNEEIESILESQEFLDMEAWPSENSIKIINGVYVISLVDGAVFHVTTTDSAVNCYLEKRKEIENATWTLYKDSKEVQVIKNIKDRCIFDDLDHGNYSIRVSDYSNGFGQYYEYSFEIK